MGGFVAAYPRRRPALSQVLEDGKFNFEMRVPKPLSGGGAISQAYRTAQTMGTIPPGALSAVCVQARHVS